MEEENKAQGVGVIPSGLFIVTTRQENGTIDGYLASWVQQVSFRPLIVSLATSPSRPGYQSILSGAPFCLNIVAQDKMQYLRYFWKGYSPEENPFVENIKTTLSENGCAHIAEAKGCIDLKFHSRVTPGDHEIVFGEVLGSRDLFPESGPKVHIRKSGLEY